MSYHLTGNVVRSAFAAVCFAATSALAGPPYVTDDPEPPDVGHWEIYEFVGGAHTQGSTEGAAGLDLNYGYSENVQLTLVAPVAFEHSGDRHTGLGVVETAVKYRFLKAQPGGAVADVAFLPRIYWPTGPERFATEEINVQLPLWAGRDFGKWSLFGGGGYQFNPGHDSRDFWLAGIGVSRTVGPRLSIGAEIYHKSPDSIDAKTFTGINFGAIYSLSEHWSLLASAGPGIHNANETAQYAFYLALRSDY